jgi:hypothetical protein
MMGPLNGLAIVPADGGERKAGDGHNVVSLWTQMGKQAGGQKPESRKSNPAVVEKYCLNQGVGEDIR